MSDFLSENSISRHLLTLGGIAAAMSSLAQLHPWIAGCGVFLAMSLVVVLVALRGESLATAIVIGVAASLGVGVSWYSGGETSLTLSLLIGLLGTVTLLVLGILVDSTSRERLRRLNDLQSQHAELVRKIYEHERKSSQSGEIPVFLASSSSEAARPARVGADSAFGVMLSETVNLPPSSTIDPDVFDFAMLLLSMQQIGHRLSSQLKLDALVSEILETAKEVLRCRRAELHLWNAQESRFQNAVPTESDSKPDSLQAVLLQSAPQPATFEWVRKQRRILTRREVLGGKLEDSTLFSVKLPVAIAPLLVGDDLVGVLVVDEAEEEGPTFLRMLHILANHCALSLKNSQMFQTIKELARRDGLTGLLNHATFLDELDRLVEESQRRRRPLTLIMSDLDHFKEFNDEHGHQAGDRVLQDVARWWQAIMPDHALLGRYGGEEFICVLPHEPLSRGIELAELLRTSVESNPVSYGGLQLHVTASFGVAELGNPAANTARLIRLADKALYRAKDKGRNQVEAHDPAQPEIAAMAESVQFSLR